MTSRENRNEKSAAWPVNDIPLDFAMTAKKLAKVQRQLLVRFEDTNKQWLSRLQTEANLASEFAGKLSSATSIPDAIVACQEWGARRGQMIAEDAVHVFDDLQKFMHAGANMLANELAAKSPPISS